MCVHYWPTPLRLRLLPGRHSSCDQLSWQRRLRHSLCDQLSWLYRLRLSWHAVVTLLQKPRLLQWSLNRLGWGTWLRASALSRLGIPRDMPRRLLHVWLHRWQLLHTQMFALLLLLLLLHAVLLDVRMCCICVRTFPATQLA